MVNTFAHMNELGGSSGSHMSTASEYWMLVIMTVFLVAVIAASAFYLSQRSNINSDSNASSAPLETLKRRLAAGEITTDEYKKLKKVIDGS